MSLLKRSCNWLLPENKSPGIEISQLTVLKAVSVPLLIVAADIATDSSLLIDMWSFVKSYQQEGLALDGLFAASCAILGFSVLNLVMGNPAKMLIRNAHTSLLMGSRELESKDVRPSIGIRLF